MIGDVSNVYMSEDDKVLDLKAGTRKLGGSCTCPPASTRPLSWTTLSSIAHVYCFGDRTYHRSASENMINYNDNTCTGKAE